MKNKIVFIFTIIFLAMIAVTTWASLYENVFAGGVKIIREPWGIATLFDTYFAFLSFYFWVCFKQNRLISKIIWFILIMLFGNIAMSVYVILSVYRIKDQFSVSRLLVEKNQYV